MMRSLLLLAALAASAHAQALKPIFNGKNLDGWTQVNGTAKYGVEKGEIVGTTVEGSPNSFLRTKKEYGDFILELDIKTDPRLNSGVQIRSHQYAKETEVETLNAGRAKRKQPAGRVYGYQVEVATAASGASGGIYDEARRGWVANIAKDPVASKAFKDNEWNHYKIEARGDSIRTWVNGVPAADLVDAADLSGFIGLQVHAMQGAPAEVRFKNIRLADLGVKTWRPLADGKTFTGWKKIGGGEWTIENGAYHGTQPGATTNNGYLASEASFKDFTLRLQYKIASGNSGVFFHARDFTSRDKDALGFEIEVDPGRDAGGLQEPRLRGWIQHIDAKEHERVYRAGDWNDMVVSAHGGRIVIIVNGYVMSELRNDAGRKEGLFALQSNARLPLDVWFRNLEIFE